MKAQDKLFAKQALSFFALITHPMSQIVWDYCWKKFFFRSYICRNSFVKETSIYQIIWKENLIWNKLFATVKKKWTEENLPLHHKQEQSVS